MTKLKIQGLTDEEVMTVITNVVKNHKSKAFGNYTEEDIAQESWIIALNKLGEFVPSRGKNKDIKQSLENWLNTVISRRLKNFYRDKYVVPQRALKSDKTDTDQVKRRNLMHPISLEEAAEERVGILNLHMIENEAWQHILHHLTDDAIDILDAILSGQIVKCYYRNKLFNQIKNIMGQKWAKANL